MLCRMESDTGIREPRRAEAACGIALLLTFFAASPALAQFFAPYCPPPYPGPFGPWPPPVMMPYAVSPPAVWATAPQRVTAASVTPLNGNLFLEVTEDFANRVVSRES